MPFLCQQHHKQLLCSSEQAKSYWNTWTNEGNKLLALHKTAEAFQFFGCSLDAAVWLIESGTQSNCLQEKNYHLEKLTFSAFSIAECCRQDRRKDLELHFLLQHHHRLLDCVRTNYKTHWPLARCIKNSLARLDTFIMEYGEFGGYKACREESYRRINDLTQCLN